MSDVEKKSETQEAAPKKKPYNLREKNSFNEYLLCA